MRTEATEATLSKSAGRAMRARGLRPRIADQQHYFLTPLDPQGLGPDDAYYSQESEDEAQQTNILKTVETNLPAAQLFAPHWRADGEAVAFTLERLQRRFYHPILVWTSAAPSQVVVLDEAFFQSLLGQRYPQWGTTTDFAGWRGEKVLVRVYNAAYPEDGHAADAGVIVSYDIRSGKIARE